jgi:transposase
MGNYNDEFKKKIVRLHIENGCSIWSHSDEFNVSKSGISSWVKKYREECQTNTETKAEYDLMAENLRLCKQLEEAEKEVLFLKKAAAFFAKEID